MKLEHSYDELMVEIQKYMSPDSVQLVQRAYEFAHSAHKEQVRKSGDPYISHPVEVAYFSTQTYTCYLLLAYFLHISSYIGHVYLSSWTCMDRWKT